jgi:phospholipid/cholesterol/gamma-HCH transport system substrate-binding protein
MNKDTIGETVLGAIVALVAVGFLAFALTRAGQSEGSGGYPLLASFNKVDGVAVGSDVRMAGVKVGAVSAVALDNSTYLAKLTLSIDQSVKVPQDSSAKIATDGLLGGAYVSLEPGGDDAVLKPGGQIEQTQGSVDLITVLSSAISGMNSNNDGGGQASEGLTP